MTKFLSAALLLALSVPSIASAAEEGAKRSFNRDGVTYVYTSTEKDGRVVLDGRAYPSGSAFRLVIVGDQVSGTSGGVPVSFKAKGTPASAPVLAAR